MKKKNSDVTDTIKWQLLDTRFVFDNEKNENISDIYLPNAYVNNSLNWIYRYFHIVGRFDLQSKKENLSFNSKYNYKKQNVTIISFSIFGNFTDEWNIKKLTDKEMILEADRNDNKHLRLKFQK